MAFDQNTVHILYKKLLNLYPRRFRERLGESMQQTFNDLYNEKSQQPLRGFLVLSIFTETAIGIAQEHLLLLMEGDAMKNIFASPRSAAFISVILALPLGLTYVIFMLEIEPLTNLLNHLFTINGQQGEINMLGRIVVFGGLLLLPTAFAVNLRPLLKSEGLEAKSRLYMPNLIVGLVILLLIIFTWGGLILEEMYCLQGIRCD